MDHGRNIIGADDLILITGASGFIGSRVVQNLLDRGFRNLRCLIRQPGKAAELRAIVGATGPTLR